MFCSLRQVREVKNKNMIFFHVFLEPFQKTHIPLQWECILIPEKGTEVNFVVNKRSYFEASLQKVKKLIIFKDIIGKFSKVFLRFLGNTQLNPTQIKAYKHKAHKWRNKKVDTKDKNNC